tara:strand:- start:11 stop:322 length:312 start_codon:yes stop_codon:yes gene_type:complete
MTKITIHDAATGETVVRDLTVEEQTSFDARNKPSPTDLEQSLIDLRNKRNKLLTETDYLGTSDNTMSSAMTTYRQTLRDLTNGLTTVEQINLVEFPTKPEIVN